MADAQAVDHLQAILDMQVKLQDRMMPFWRNIEERTGYNAITLYLKENCLMLAKEAMEAMDNTAWKSHKRSFGDPQSDEDRQHYIEETVDCLHFLLNMFAFAGVTTSEEIYRLYCVKNGINHERQDHDY